MALTIIAFLLFTAIAVSPLATVSYTGMLTLPAFGLIATVGTLTPESAERRADSVRKERKNLIVPLLVAAVLSWVLPAPLLINSLSNPAARLALLLITLTFQGVCLFHFSKRLIIFKAGGGCKMEPIASPSGIPFLPLPMNVFFALLPYLMLILSGRTGQSPNAQLAYLQASLSWETVDVPARYDDLAHLPPSSQPTDPLAVACTLFLIASLACFVLGPHFKSQNKDLPSSALSLAFGLILTVPSALTETFITQHAIEKAFFLIAAMLLVTFFASKIQAQQRSESETEMGPKIDLSPYGLSARERIAAELHLQMHSSSEIAEKMELSASTVRTYLSRALAKIGAASWETARASLCKQSSNTLEADSSNETSPARKTERPAIVLRAYAALLAGLGCCNALGLNLGAESESYAALGRLLLLLPALIAITIELDVTSNLKSPAAHRKAIDSAFPLAVGALTSFSLAFPFAAFQSLALKCAGAGVSIVALLGCWTLPNARRQQPAECLSTLASFAAGALLSYSLTSLCGLYCQTALLLDDSLLFSVAIPVLAFITLAALGACLLGIARLRKSFIARAPHAEALNTGRAKTFLHACGMSDLAAEIVVLSANGMTTSRICADLHVAPGTVQGARYRAYKILDVHDSRSLREALLQRTS